MSSSRHHKHGHHKKNSKKHSSSSSSDSSLTGRNNNTPSKSTPTSSRRSQRNVMDVAKEVAPNAAAFLAEALAAEDSDDDYENDFDFEDDNNNTKPDDSPLSLPSSMMSDDGADLPTYTPLKMDAYKTSSSNVASSSSAYNANADTLASIEEQNRRLAHEKELLQMDLQRARARYRNDMGSLRTESKAQMEAVRSKQAQLEAELPVLRDRAAADKNRFRDLVVSDVLFQELSAIPEKKQSLREFILCKVHRMMQDVKDEAERSRQEVESLRTALTRSKEDSDRRSRDAEHRAKIAEERAKQLEHDLEQSSKRYVAMTQRLQTSVKEAEMNRAKAAAFNDLEKQCKEAENERDSLKEQNNRLERRLEIAIKHGETNDSENTEFKQQNQLLRVDKAYLQREVAQTNARIEVLTKDVESLTMKNRALIRAKEQYYEQLLNAKDAARIGYEERLNKEINLLHENNRKELQELREQSEKVYDRENKALREAKNHCEDKLRQCEIKLDAMERSNDESRLALAKAHGDREQESASLRAEVKVKNYELERSTILMEEKTTIIRTLELDLEKSKSKFNILREEFARLDAMTRSSGTLALVDNNFSSSNNNTFDPHKEEELRRLRSQIVILEREKSSLADKLKTATEDINDLRQATGQPQEYFMGLVDKAKKETASLKNVIEELQGDMDALRDGKMSAEAQLKSLLTNRQQLKELKRALANAGVNLSSFQQSSGQQQSRGNNNSNGSGGSPSWYRRLVKT